MAVQVRLWVLVSARLAVIMPRIWLLDDISLLLCTVALVRRMLGVLVLWTMLLAWGDRGHLVVVSIIAMVVLLC